MTRHKLSEILSPSFLFYAPYLIFLGIVTIIFYIMGIFFDPSLGLTAFSLLMWVTLPWAFLDQLTLQKIRKRWAGASEDDLRRTNNWLRDGTLFFLLSGITFMMSAIIDLVLPALETTNPNPPFPMFYFSVITFIFGLSVLSFAIFRTHQVIYFLLYPASIKRIVQFPSELGRVVSDLASIGILFLFWFFDLSVFISTLYSIVILHLPLSIQGIVLMISLFVGSLGIFPLLISLRRQLGRRDVIIPIMILNPLLVLFLITVKVL